MLLPKNTAKKTPIICLMGPTAAGKTQLAVDIVSRLPCEIVSVDSVMVYRGFNIGAAKPDAAILRKAPHHLLDILDPADIYSAGRFRVDAMHAIADIIKRGKIPLLVGGTMLYFRVLQQGLSSLPSANSAIRAVIAARAEKFGWQTLHTMLLNIDRNAALRIHQHDSQRIARALEVYWLTGRTMTEWHATQTIQSLANDYQIHHLILNTCDRKQLHERIEKRFDLMLQQGFIDEVRTLYNRDDLNPTLPSIRSAGYAQVWSYLGNEMSYQEMRERAIFATRQLAKRQLTWLRSNTFKDATWFRSDAKQNLTKQVLTLLEQCLN